MAYSILLAAKKPEQGDDWQANQMYAADYEYLSRILPEISKQHAGIQLLAESTILIQLDKGLQGLLDVLKSVRRLPYTYTVLTEDIKWIEAANRG